MTIRFETSGVASSNSRLMPERSPELQNARLSELREVVLSKGCAFGPIYETPVGFKYIGELINEDKIVIGVEESAGLSIKGHSTQKDGILACVLAAEAVASSGKGLTQQLEDVRSTRNQ